MAYSKKENPGIMLYWAAFDALEVMSDAEAKQMLRAMRQYAQEGKEPDFSGMASMQMAWCFMRDHIDRDRERYEKIRELRSESGKKGGESSGKSRRASAAKKDEKTSSPWGL